MQQASRLPDGTYYIKPMLEWEDFVAEAAEAEQRRAEARARAEAARQNRRPILDIEDKIR